MRLVDAAFTYEEERSTALGKGFRCGFLGMLHFEIITERVRRQAGIELVVTAPSTDFTVTMKNGETNSIATPSKFLTDMKLSQLLNHGVAVDIIAPAEICANSIAITLEHEGFVLQVDDFKTTDVLCEVKCRSAK